MCKQAKWFDGYYLGFVTYGFRSPVSSTCKCGVEPVREGILEHQSAFKLLSTAHSGPVTKQARNDVTLLCLEKLRYSST